MKCASVLSATTLALLALLIAPHALAQQVVFAEADASSQAPVVVSSHQSDPASNAAAQPRREGPVIHHGRAANLPRDDEQPPAAPTIVGGKRVPAKLRKHLARVVIETSDGGIVSCSGSVLSPTFVLSAAHCFVDPGRIDVSRSYVLVAERTTNIRYFSSPPNKIFMRNVFVHRRYRDNGFFADDVALVELQQPIPQRFLSPVSLVSPPSQSGSKLQAAGYGVSASNGNQPRRVRRADVLFQRWSVCDDFAGFPVANNRRREMCYTSLDFPDRGRTGTCFGDSGGPIMKREGGQFKQVGITSYFVGDRCESAGSVMVAMQVSRYRQMIRRKVLRGRNRGWRRL